MQHNFRIQGHTLNLRTSLYGHQRYGAFAIVSLYEVLLSQSSKS